MDSELERELEQVRYHEWILNELKKHRADNEIPRESGDSSLDSLKRGIGWYE